MVDQLDPRVIQISIEIDGEFRVYRDLRMTVKGQKTSNPLQNNCEVEITNLAKETRNYLLTETSPFNANRSPKRMIVEAGRVSTGLTQVFYGEITAASPTQPPDIGLNLKAQTGSYAKGMVVARSGAALQSLKTIAQGVAGDLGASLDFQATDKQISNYSFSGPALRQIEALNAAGGVNAYLDDQTLVVKNASEPLTNRVREISAESGMIGIPEVTEHGIKVTYLFDANTVCGGALEVTSVLNPAVNGSYTIFSLDFDLTTHEEPFYYTADARRKVFYTPPKKKRAS